MSPRLDLSPESLDYLPGAFRAEIEAPDAVKHHFVRWLLEVFETNLHLAERIAQNSGMLFDSQQVARFSSQIAAPTLAARDLVDAPALASKIRAHAEPLSKHLWQRFSEPARRTLSTWDAADVDVAFLQTVLAEELNQIIWSGPLYDLDRFRAIKFSPATRVLLKENHQGEALAQFNRRLLEDAYAAEIMALPESVILHPERWELDLLRWLASWVALYLDEDWIQEKPHETAAATTETEPPSHYQKARDLIQQAAVLYRARGTPRGLTEMIKQFYGWDVEIVERSSPQGMEVGSGCAIGLNSWILDEPDLDEQFTVLLKSTDANRQRLVRSGISEMGDLVRSPLIGRSGPRQIESLWTVEKPGQVQAASSSPDRLGGRAELVAAVNKLRNLIESEKPVQTGFYLAFESAGVLTIPSHSNFLVIGVYSEIDRFWIS